MRGTESPCATTSVGLGGFGGQLFVGSAQTVADELEAYAERSGVDGFNITYHITPGSFADVAEYLIPELRRRGRARESGDPAKPAAATVRYASPPCCPTTILAQPSGQAKESCRFDS